MEADLIQDLGVMREKYLSKLGKLFHHKSATDLARLSLDPNYVNFVNDYVTTVCTSEFRREYEKAKEGQLEQVAQQAPRKSFEEVGFALRDAVTCESDVQQPKSAQQAPKLKSAQELLQNVSARAGNVPRAPRQGPHVSEGEFQ